MGEPAPPPAPSTVRRSAGTDVSGRKRLVPALLRSASSLGGRLLARLGLQVIGGLGFQRDARPTAAPPSEAHVHLVRARALGVLRAAILRRLALHQHPAACAL